MSNDDRFCLEIHGQDFIENDLWCLIYNLIDHKIDLDMGRMFSKLKNNHQGQRI